MERLRETVLRPPLGDRFSVPKNVATLSGFQAAPSSFMSGGNVGGPASLPPFMPFMMSGPTMSGAPSFMSYQFPWMPPGFGSPGAGVPTMTTPGVIPSGPQGGGDPGNETPLDEWDHSSGGPPSSPRTRVFRARLGEAIPLTYDDVMQNGNQDVFPWRWKYKWFNESFTTPPGTHPNWEDNPTGEVRYALNLCESRNWYVASYWLTGTGMELGPHGAIDGGFEFPMFSWANSVEFPTLPADPNERLHGAPYPIGQAQQVLMLEEWTYSEVGNPTSPLTATYWFHVVNARREFPQIPAGGNAGQVLKVSQAPGEPTGMPLVYWANP